MKSIFSISFLFLSLAVRAQATAPVKEAEPGFWTAGPIIALALAVIACVVAVWSYIKSENLKKEIKALKSSVKSDIKKSSDINQNKNNSDIKKLELKISDLQDLVSELQSKLTIIINKAAAKVETSVSSYAENKKPVFESKVVEIESRKEPEYVNRVIYFGPPRGNRFTGGRSSFTPGQSIYSINDKGKGEVEFSFADRKEALSVALRSVTDYIESACIIVGNPSSNPSKVVTLKPGVAKREGNDWIIENKAQINLI